MAAKIRKHYANITATVALVIAAGLGGAKAADLIGAKDIRKNAVRPLHLKFPLGVKAQFSALEIVSNGGPQTLLSKTFKVRDRGAALPLATVEVEGLTGGQVDFQLFIDGIEVGGLYTQTVAAGEIQTVTVPMPNPDGLKRGKHAFRVAAVAGTGDVAFRDRQLNVVMTPEGCSCS